MKTRGPPVAHALLSLGGGEKELALGAGQCTFLLRRLEEAGPLFYREPRGHDGGNAASCGGVERGVQRGGGIPAAARARLKRKLVQRLSGAIVSAASGF